MNIEIERKFLIANDGWRPLATSVLRIRDGLIADCDGRKVRVRICDGSGSITLKGRRDGIARSEFTYPVPVEEAEELLKTMCDDRLVEKTRYQVPQEGLTWSIDLYQGALSGIVLAEIELPVADHPFAKPGWLGAEVTNDPRYRKVNLLAASLGGATLRPQQFAHTA